MKGHHENTFGVRRLEWFPLLILALVTLGVYAVSLFNGFVLDDEFIIAKNPLTLSLSNLQTVLFSPDVINPYYRPLNRATYLFDYWVFGMSPTWFHAANIFIHLLNVLLLYRVACRVLQKWEAALVAALLFAVHPVNSEPVNFISARNTLLSLFFCLASFVTFMQAKEKGLRWPIASALLFFCGLLSKETSFMLILLVALYMLFPLPGTISEKGRMNLLSLLPYLLSAAVYFAMRIYSLHGVMGIPVADSGILGRLTQNYYVVPQYIALLLFPTDLTVCHSVTEGGLLTLSWMLPWWVAFVIAIALVVWSRNKAALLGLVWCAINYLPISNIVAIPSEPMTERYLYLPAVGAFLMVGAGIAHLCGYERVRRAVWATAAAVIIFFAFLTVSRNLDWKDDYSLFASAVRINPASSEAHYNLGTALREKGDLTAARQEWETALKINPSNSDALIQMGTFEATRGNLQKAEQYYIAAIRSPRGRVDHEKAMAHYNLAKIYEKWQMPELALQHYELFLERFDIYNAEYEPDARRRVAQLRASIHSGPTK